MTTRPHWHRSLRTAAFAVKRAIPYGEHMLWANHDNNGKTAMAAMLFAVQGDRTREAQCFAKMITASYQNRE